MAPWMDISTLVVVVGIAGAVLAAASAIVAAAAVVFGAPSLGGIATASWLVSVMLSFCGAVTGGWLFPAVAIGSMPVALIAAAVIALLRVTLFRGHGVSRRSAAPSSAQPAR